MPQRSHSVRNASQASADTSGSRHWLGVLVKTWIADVAGNITTSDSLIYHSSSPARFVTSTSPPTLLIQGQADTVVPYQQSDLMNAKLNQFSVPHVYKLYPNEGHSYSGAAANDALSQTQTFLNTYLN